MTVETSAAAKRSGTTARPPATHPGRLVVTSDGFATYSRLGRCGDHSITVRKRSVANVENGIRRQFSYHPLKHVL